MMKGKNYEAYVVIFAVMLFSLGTAIPCPVLKDP
jgi:hypothetical protein